MTRAVLSLNVGSSSIKIALFALGEGGEVERLASGLVEEIGAAPRFLAGLEGDEREVIAEWHDGAPLRHKDLLGEVMRWVGDHLAGIDLVACGHRVVHGGTAFSGPVEIDDRVVEQLDELSSLAPLHQPHNLAAIRATRALLPDVPQIACFDTAFHTTRPELATRFALPRDLHDAGVRRYGFHGLSYEFIARSLREADAVSAEGRVIAAHLGNGASMCAMQAGRSVDTTMGFTALDGLMMGTRSGALDPGAVLHLIRHEGRSAGEVERLLYKQSGLLGVSGISSDMRVLLESDAPEAGEAVALFCWRAAREAGGLVASLGGLDTLVFTAGIGEHQPAIRARICAALEWCGIALDAEANAANAAIISAAGSAVTVRVMPTDEERMIAIHTVETLGLRLGEPA